MNPFRYHIGRFWKNLIIEWVALFTILAVPLALWLDTAPSDLIHGDTKSLFNRIALGLAALLAVLVAPGLIRRQRRATVFAAVRRRLGFEPLNGQPRTRPELELFMGGDAGYDLRLLAGGVDGRPVRVGDHELAVFLPIGLLCDAIEITGWGPAEDTATVNFSYAFTPCVQTHFPRMIIRSEHLTDRVKAAAGFTPIQFESEEFSRKFHVASEDRRFAYEIVTPAFMALLLDHPGHAVLFDRCGVTIYKGVRQWTADEFETAAKLCVAVAKAVPEYVWEEYPDRLTAAGH
ncbi:MAG: hypothetical protein ACREJ2_12615 [Planctomycetota bacterium]